MPDKTSKAKEERIVLGSGDCYVAEATQADIDTDDIDAILAKYVKDENRFGNTKNGATLTYTPTSYTAKCDFGRVTKTKIISEEVKLETGSITVSPGMMEKLIETARMYTSTKGLVTLKIGGVLNTASKLFVVIFHHIDPVDGDIWITILGKHDGELSFQFQPETESVINPTFLAQAMDKDGTLLLESFAEPGTDVTTPTTGGGA